MRAAIYARVSTKDKGQDTENQLVQLREYARRQQWEITCEYIDHESGKTGDRDAFWQLFAAASRCKFDVVLVWALDRFTREGVYETFNHIHRLTGYDVQFESLTEPHFRTTGPAGELMLAIAAWIAKQERIRISERTKAGVARAPQPGQALRAPGQSLPEDQAMEMRQAGMSWRAIAAQLGVSFMTVKRAVQGRN